jgi:NADPH2:quinone reductase
LLAAYGTSYHALVDRALAMPGETLLVLGASGSVGTAAIQVGKALGLKVIAVASTPEKLDFCRAQGADEVINYSVENVKEAARQLTAGAGVDIVLDLVGGSMTDQVLSAMKWKGRLLILGFTSGTIPSIAMNRLLLKGCAAIGVYYGAFMKQEPEKNAKNVEKLMKLFEDRKIFPMISREYPLERAVDALRHIAARGSLGKITLLTERGRTGA